MSTIAEEREYDRAHAAVFCKTTEEFGGLSNMAAGFPLRVNGVNILTSEALYQACRFPHLPDVQRLIIDQKSPMTAKMKSKPHRGQSRQNWVNVRVRLMRWCLRVKLAQNWSKFRELLLTTGDRPIVEESKKDRFWGAFAQPDGTLIGRNVLGRLLMELREAVKQPTCESLKRVEPVPIPDFLLYGEPIQVVQAWLMPSEPVTDPDLNPPKATLWDVADEPEQNPTTNGQGPANGEDTSRSEIEHQPETPAPTVPDPQPLSAEHPARQNKPLVRRLIEVDLPIARISAHARREKSIRHGHISTLHIWWARRPLAACRAVICAALWPDPADALCPHGFRVDAVRIITAFARKAVGKGEKIGTPGLVRTSSPESFARWQTLASAGTPLDPGSEPHQNVLRFALLDFIADFANWDNSTVPEYLETARALTQAAHEALGGEKGTRPLVVDPFAGGGSIPLEALRVGADAFASDLNPVAVLLNKVVLEYIPKYGQRLADEVRKWGKWIKEQAEKELGEFYPKDPDGATPIAYLWARTIQCEGAGCGAEVPLMRSLWLARRAGGVNPRTGRSVALRLVADREAKRVDFAIIPDAKAKDVGEGTVKRGSATCPVCGFTTPVKSVREQLKKRRGGAADARLFCVVMTRMDQQGRFYRLPTDRDLGAARKAGAELEGRKNAHKASLGLVPNEALPPQGSLGFRVQLYGMDQWGDLFTPRQGLTLTTLVRLVRTVGDRLVTGGGDKAFAEAVQTTLSLLPGKQADLGNSLCAWEPIAQCPRHLFGRQAIPIVWDFAEGVPTGQSSGAWEVLTENFVSTLARNGSDWQVGSAQQADATRHPLPSDVAQVLFTDPPYYDAVPYSDLSDFFFVWLKRMIAGFGEGATVTPKTEECIVDEVKGKDRAFFEQTMQQALADAQRVVVPGGVGVVVFAHKSTAGWEAQLQAMIDAGWIVTGSWPIDTECGSRLRAMDSAALASSVHIVCRPRGKAHGTVVEAIGEWGDVLTELPKRMHEWMPRLASEGVVGADAIFACLGPALEIFSRFSRVEKANGEAVVLREYLEHVWAAVSKEALSVIFRDVDTAGLGPDARLTAMWLWTLGGAAPAANGNGETPADEQDEEATAEDEEASSGKPVPSSGYTLEFDAARRIAQGLGVHLEKSVSIVEVKGDKARLLPVVERTRYLFGKDTEAETGGKRGKKKIQQKGLFDELGPDAPEAGRAEIKAPPLGVTALDRVHQAMLLFGAQRGELLKRFLLEDGVGKDARFWKLAQSLSALYPAGSDEKRWVDGVLARKKGLGL